jgi:hypothetical protein
MPKIDKSQYTKAEWKVFKAKRQEEKEKLNFEQSLDSFIPTSNGTVNILCIKHGNKYNEDYVNTLYKMVERNISLPFRFVCLTDNNKNLLDKIETLPLPANLTGWWCKPYMFNKNLPLKGTTLYMDLDVVIAGNIDKLFTFNPGKWCTIRDFTRAMRPKWEKYNSSVIRFEHGQLDYVWQQFEKNPQHHMRRHFGDQDYLYEITKGTASLYPDSWIQSWKWEVRTDKTFEPGGIKGNRKFKTIQNVKPRIECCVTVFHGDPNPHNCHDPWVIDNWQ